MPIPARNNPARLCQTNHQWIKITDTNSRRSGCGSAALPVLRCNSPSGVLITITGNATAAALPIRPSHCRRGAANAIQSSNQSHPPRGNPKYVDTVKFHQISSNQSNLPQISITYKTEKEVKEEEEAGGREERDFEKKKNISI